MPLSAHFYVRSILAIVLSTGHKDFVKKFYGWIPSLLPPLPFIQAWECPLVGLAYSPSIRFAAETSIIFVLLYLPSLV